MFLSTINRLKEEQARDNFLKSYCRENVHKPNIHKIGGGRRCGEECIVSVSKISKRINKGKNMLTGCNHENKLNEPNIPQRKTPNKTGKAVREQKISSFQQILNIAMASSHDEITESCLGSSNRKPIANRRVNIDNFAASGSCDSFPGYTNSRFKSDDHKNQKGSGNVRGDTEDERDSPPRINFVRIICNGKDDDHGKSISDQTTSSSKKKDDSKYRGKNNKCVTSNKRLKAEDSANIQGFEFTSKQSGAKNTKKDGEAAKLSHKDQDKGKEIPRRKATEIKSKRPNTSTPKAMEKGEKENSKSENSTDNCSEEKNETYKKNILTLKTKNNLIKNMIKEQTDDDFFSNILVSTPSSSRCKKTRKSMGFEQSPSISIFSPGTFDSRLLKTGLTPVNNGPNSVTYNSKVSTRKDQTKKGSETFYLSPISSCIKEITSGEDTNQNSSYSKSSASKSISDILSGLEGVCGSKTRRLGKLSCVKQNKFVMQIHEKLTSGSYCQKDQPEHNPTSQSKNAEKSVQYKTSKGSLDIKINLDSVLDQEMENCTRIADEEKQQELLWSITEDSSIQKEDKNLLIEELIACTTYEQDL